MKTYKEIVDDVKAKNPSLKMKDVQTIASGIFKQAKIASDEAKELTQTPVINAAAQPTPAQTKANLDSNLSDAVDAAIRENIRKTGSNKHVILNTGKNFNPDFYLVKGEKVGVNTKCWLEGPCRVPASGHYLIFN